MLKLVLLESILFHIILLVQMVVFFRTFIHCKYTLFKKNTNLVLELVVFAEELVAEWALVNSPSVRPNVPLALNAHGVQQGALASVHLQALSPVAHPSLAYVAYRAHHPHSCERENLRVWCFINSKLYQKN